MAEKLILQIPRHFKSLSDSRVNWAILASFRLGSQILEHPRTVFIDAGQDTVVVELLESYKRVPTVSYEVDVSNERIWPAKSLLTASKVLESLEFWKLMEFVYYHGTVKLYAGGREFEL